MPACRRPGRESGALDITAATLNRLLPNPSLRKVEAVLDTIGFCNDTRSIAPAAGKKAAATVSRKAYLRIALGLTRLKHGKPVLARQTPLRPRLCKLLFALHRRLFPSHLISSIAVAKGSMAGIHRDAANLGDTALVALGRFTGGNLWVADGSKRGSVIKTKLKPSLKRSKSAQYVVHVDARQQQLDNTKSGSFRRA